MEKFLEKLAKAGITGFDFSLEKIEGCSEGEIGAVIFQTVFPSCNRPVFEQYSVRGEENIIKKLTEEIGKKIVPKRVIFITLIKGNVIAYGHKKIS